MTAPSLASLLDRCSLEGVAWEATPQEGEFELRIRKLEATSLRVAWGMWTVEIGQAALHQLVGRVRTGAGVPRLLCFEAKEAELSGVTLQAVIQGRGVAVPGAAGPDAWKLAPLASAEGTVRAQITDAHLLFDADVTVPIRHGRVDFNDATVEHVGPDSRMGVSRLGFYVDAPNGRSYLYPFPSAPLAGVEFEERGALLGPGVSERGKVHLQPFVESFLRQAGAGQGPGLTQQARTLLGRTSLSGELRLGDGPIAMPGVQARLEGAAQGRNALRIRSAAMSHGVIVDIASLRLRDAVARWPSLLDSQPQEPPQTGQA